MLMKTCTHLVDKILRESELNVVNVEYHRSDVACTVRFSVREDLVACAELACGLRARMTHRSNASTTRRLVHRAHITAATTFGTHMFLWMASYTLLMGTIPEC